MQIHLENLSKLDFRSNEAYKSLRTNIKFCGNDIKTICFTSCLANEGKSNVSFNLAVSLAESGSRVAFIDADLRRSIIIGRYRPNQEVLGLTYYLTDQSLLDDIIYETNIENLDMIFTGPNPPNPAELLGSDIFNGLVKILRIEYDYIIIDTPPLGSVIDSAIVAEQCDGVIIVIESKATSYKLAQRVKKQLDKGHCKILGAVLNKIDNKNRYYRDHGKRYKDAYYTAYEANMREKI